MKFSLTRALILSTISENQPISVSDLAKKINLSKGTSIYRYLEELKKRGLIIMEKEKDVSKIKKGNPTFIRTTKKANAFDSKDVKKLLNLKEKLF